MSIDRTGQLPRTTRRSRDPEQNRAIARLVLDGVLLMRTSSGDVIGPSALEHVWDAGTPSQSAALSYTLTVRALRHAAALPVSTPDVVAPRLYRFHTLPRADAVESRFYDPAAVRAFLGLERWSLSRRGFQRRDPPASNSYWEIWSKSSERRSRYKLYVSPTLPALPTVLEAVLDVLDHHEVATLKVGVTLPGLLRPDRLVIHFAERAHLFEAAAALELALARVAPHGVPLTAPLGASGLLSWGIDPGSMDGTSWRLWLSYLLAFALFTARAERARGVAPERFALARLALEGVDPATLAPTELFSTLHGDASGRA